VVVPAAGIVQLHCYREPESAPLLRFKQSYCGIYDFGISCERHLQFRADQRWLSDSSLLMSEATSGFSAVSKDGGQRQGEVPELPYPHIYTQELWHTMGYSVVQDSAASKAGDEAVK
jgi:hypothetical protein